MAFTFLPNTLSDSSEEKTNEISKKMKKVQTKIKRKVLDTAQRWTTELADEHRKKGEKYMIKPNKGIERRA